jgi:hypothetical protein
MWMRKKPKRWLMQLSLSFLIKVKVLIMLGLIFRMSEPYLWYIDKFCIRKSNKYLFFCCHSPTQPQLEFELDLLMGRKPPTPPHPGTFKALPDNLGSWFSVCNLILTQLIRRPKKKGRLHKKNKKMEDDLKKKEDKPINQNQPNWLWHLCKFT